jgi:hypothetical protein
MSFIVPGVLRSAILQEYSVKETHRRCGGIDVHKKSVTVCVLAPFGQRHIEVKKRKFRTFTRDLKQMRAWLKNCQVTEIAMESTGQYWRPLWNLLEGEFAKLILVNPQHIKGLNGYKTDPKDAQWIADLLENGKLRGSWVPPKPIRELRDLTRHRVNLLEDLNRAKNRIEQLCQTGNIKVSSVATDLFGVSGRKMLKAIVEGKRDPGWMADYARGRCAARGGSWSWLSRGRSPASSDGCWTRNCGKWNGWRRKRRRSNRRSSGGLRGTHAAAADDSGDRSQDGLDHRGRSGSGSERIRRRQASG